MNLEHLTTLIQKYGLLDGQTEILASVQPAIFLKLGDAGPGTIGQSRIGGVPDLPASMGWPKDALLGKYLCFILQINLAELPVFPESPLPTQGMLYFFASEGEDTAEQVVFYGGGEPLQPASAPDSESLITDWYVDMVAHCLTFQLAADIPRWATKDFEVLCDLIPTNSNMAGDRLDELAGQLSKGTVGKLLGHGAGIGHDPREDAYVVRDVNPKWLYDYEQRKTLDMTQAGCWRDLLQIESSGAVDLWFGDAGYVQVLIDTEDLSNLDFSRVYVGLESS